MALYSVFVRKVPLNPKQANKQTIRLCYNDFIRSQALRAGILRPSTLRFHG